MFMSKKDLKDLLSLGYQLDDYQIHNVLSSKDCETLDAMMEYYKGSLVLSQDFINSLIEEGDIEFLECLAQYDLDTSELDKEEIQETKDGFKRKYHMAKSILKIL